jgi:hypothetical protein
MHSDLKPVTAQPAQTVQQDVVRDDRILPEVKWIGAIVVLVLITAFVILYLLPDRTSDFFAWKITPQMTPLLMGGGYLGGAYFFVRVVMATRWHTISHGFIPITVFTWFMLFATLLHMDKFTPGHLAFYTWFSLYIITPLLIPFLWFRNRAADPGNIEPGEIIVPQIARNIASVLGVFLLGVAVMLFILPFLGENGLNLWAWKVSPLTMQVIAGWCALTGAAGPVLGRERRWSAWKYLAEGQSVALVLILLGAVRSWGDYRPGNVSTWFFLGLLSFILLCNVVLYITMESRRRKALQRSTPTITA